MIRAQRAAAVLLIVTGSAWLLFNLTARFTAFTHPYFIWVFAVIIGGMVMYKWRGKN